MHSEIIAIDGSSSLENCAEDGYAERPVQPVRRAAAAVLPHNGAGVGSSDSSEGTVAASTEILIGDPTAQHVLIRPVGRSTPGLFDSWDGNRLDCCIDLVVSGFRGSVQADLRSEDFETFREQLEGLSSSLEGAAGLTGLDGQIALSLTTDADGNLRVSGEAVDLPGSGNRLQFAFAVDRRYLPQVIRSLEALLAAFPVLDAPDA